MNTTECTSCTKPVEPSTLAYAAANGWQTGEEQCADCEGLALTTTKET